jgi:Dolichyl-phosphate-mannose-protein mannosyltransferase
MLKSVLNNSLDNPAIPTSTFLLAKCSTTSRVAGLKQNRWSLHLIVLSTAAAGAYSFHLGYHSLGPSEAYSALAAMQPTVRMVVQNAMEFDPGKPVLYHLLLHWFCGCFGIRETAVRGFSLFFGLACVPLLFAYGRQLFGAQVGLAAAAIWAFNPLALIFARWARMYSLVVAFALAHLLAMAKLRQQPSTATTLLAGVLGAAMLYSHLAALLLVGADVIVVVREFERDGRSVSWPAVALALALFVPFMRSAEVQSRALLFGHWLDWIGVHHASAAARILVAGLAVGVLLWLSLGARRLADGAESVLCCSLYVVVPLLALGAGSVVIRPMFAVRYVAPSFAVGAVLLAWVLDQRGARLRNDVAFAITALFVMLLPLSYAAQDQPWRRIAGRVAAAGFVHETIFFESGFFSPEGVIEGEKNDGFPQGFFLVPFKYYFKQANPEAALPGGDWVRARQLIAAAVKNAGGAWLISGKNRQDALAELPSAAQFQLDFEQDFSRVRVLHVRLLHRR